MSPHKSFGAAIYELRVAAKLTQGAVASMAGMSGGYLSEIENGRKFAPPPRVCEKLLTVLKADEPTRIAILELCKSERLLIRAGIRRLAPPHVGELIERVALAASKMSRGDAARITALLQELQM